MNEEKSESLIFMRDHFLQLEESEESEVSQGEILQLSQNSDDRIDLQHENSRVEPPLLHPPPLFKDYHRRNKNSIRYVKYVAHQSLRKMKFKALFEFWKKNGDLRNNKHCIILFLLIVNHESEEALLKFCEIMKSYCEEISCKNLAGSPSKFKKWVELNFFEDIVFNLNLAVRSCEIFAATKSIEKSLANMFHEQKKDCEPYKKSLEKVFEYKQIIDSGLHKQHLSKPEK